jgi:hypothetical protein
MIRQRSRGRFCFAVILTISLAASACGGSSASATVGDATPIPTPTLVTTATPEITPTPAPTPTPTPAPTAAPTITATPAATPTAATTPGPGAKCVGSPAAREWFADQATHFTWNVYCASALPSGWGIDPINKATARYTGVGYMEVWYAGPSGSVMWLREGDFCSTVGCSLSPNSGLIGPAKIGDMSGKLYWEETLLVILVNPGTNHAYTLYSEDVSQSTFLDYAGHFVRVPRP